MLTAYGEQVNPAAPRQEYPRPQLVRDSYINLNGRWEFVGAPRDAVPKRFAAQIVVPFPPESALSGIGRPTPKGFALWYRRSFRLPPDFSRGRILLHLDAADQAVTLWINGEKAGTHTGGYTPFTADITALVREDNIIMLRVEDVPAAFCAFGAQKRHSGWSGLWQSVWLESVPEQYIAGLVITPRLQEQSVEVTVLPGGSAPEGCPCVAEVNGTAYELCAGTPYSLPAAGCRFWTPESPTLYPLDVTLGEDRVESYFAMRELSVGRDERGTARFFLNGEPYFVNGAVYQGYWPDGLSAAPSDDAIRADIESAKSLGFNALRLTDKVECARFYHCCDVLGMLIWQGIPTGGRDTPPAIPVGDDKYGFYGRKEPESRQQYMHELREIAELLRCVPCVAAWELFDSSRGRFDAADVLRYLRELDDSRIIDPVSGADARCGAVVSVQSAANRFRIAPDKNGRAVYISLCGAFGHLADGHVWSDAAGAKNDLLDSPQQLAFAVQELYSDTLSAAVRQGLAGCFFSQLTDVENDVTGLISYDRRIFKIAPKAFRGLNRIDY